MTSGSRTKQLWRTLTYDWVIKEKRFRWCGGPWQESQQSALAWANWLYARGFRVRIERNDALGHLYEFDPLKAISAYF